MGIIHTRYLEDIAEAIRVKTGSQDTFTPSEMADAILTIDGSLSGSITPSSVTDVGLITNATLEDIADAIRTKLDVETLYTPADMADAILSIQGGVVLPDLDATTVQVWAQNGSGFPKSNTKQKTSYSSGGAIYWTPDSTPSGYRLYGSQASNVTSSLSEPIPDGYKKLYIDMYSSGRSGSYNLLTMYLRSAYGVTGAYGGQFAGTNLASINLVNYNQTYNQIAEQSRLL